MISVKCDKYCVYNNFMVSYFVVKFVIFFTQYCFQGVVLNVYNILTFYYYCCGECVIVWFTRCGILISICEFVLLVHKVFISFMERIFLIGQ